MGPFHRLSLFLFSLFPQIQMVALCNSRAMGEANTNSDIDLFIIAKKENLWTARCIVTVLTGLFGVRRRNTHGLTKGSPEYIKRTKDRYCLSFFVTEEALDLTPISIENDIYLDRWIRTLIPLVNTDGTYERFMRANGVAPTHMYMNTPWQSFCLKLSVFFGFLSLFENPIKKLWLPKTLETYEKLGKPWGVVISDTMLKFHDNDQRKIWRELHK